MDIKITNGNDYNMWIDSYSDDTIIVNEILYTGAISIQQNTVIPLSKNFNQLSLADFQQIIELKPEILIIGTGKQQLSLPIKILVTLQQQGISIETMNTASACRTFNLLISDAREVYAWIWPATTFTPL